MSKIKRSKTDFSKDSSVKPWHGTVVKTTGASFMVRPDFPVNDSNQIQECRVKGKFRLKGIRTTNPVAVGDKVTVTHAEGGISYITEIDPRKNYIIRRASNLSKESHILAANIDQAILVATLKDPETPLVFIDRFLATCEAYSIPAVIVINKTDILDEEYGQIIEGLKYLYESLGYGFLTTSVVSGEGIDTLRKITKDRLSLMAGNSGVGKTSLINTLVPGLDLKTGKISDIHKTGMHTTTFSEMITLPYGGELIDIPGVKGFGMIDFTPDEVSHYFPEIFEAGKECKYSDCKHIDEPGCAVREKIQEHYISESRYNSYLNILEEVKDVDGKYRKAF